MNRINNETAATYTAKIEPSQQGSLLILRERFTEEQILEAAEAIYLRKCQEGGARGDALTSPSEAEHWVVTYIKSRASHLQHEEFGVVWLDNQHRVLKVETLFNGTIDGAAVYPREVVRAALDANAAAVILFHNHPSGVSEPSQSDKDITIKLTDSLKAIEVRVLDHLVVGLPSVTSFAQRGLL